MQLPATNIFLDTEVFVSANFNCRSERFKTIVSYAKGKDIRLFLTDVVDREVRKKIVGAVDYAYESLAKVKDGTRVLNNDDEFRQATSKEKKDTYKQTLRSVYESFLRDGQVELIDTTKVTTGPIMDLYFESKPPFDRREKKHEFPDAVSVQSIADWTTKNNTNAIIVSKDKDVEDLVSSLGMATRITCLISIEQLISNIVASKEYEENVESAIRAAKDSFQEQLADIVADADISIRRFDAEVQGQSIGSYEITLVNILRAEDDYALCECEFEIELELHIAYDDQGSFWRDREEKEAYDTNRKHSTMCKVGYFYLEVELTRTDRESDWTVHLIPSSLSKSLDLDLN